MSIVCDFKGFDKDKEVTKLNKAVVEMTNDFNLGVGEDDIKELLEAIPEELTNELLEPEQEHTAEEEAKEKYRRKKKKGNPRKFTLKSLAEALADLKNFFKSLKTWTLIPKSFY